LPPDRINVSKELAMESNPSFQDKPGTSSPSAGDGEPVQTGALPGGQPGEGVNTSSSPTGQSNVDAQVREGVEYGKTGVTPR
jgi:hypothetical protein